MKESRRKARGGQAEKRRALHSAAVRFYRTARTPPMEGAAGLGAEKDYRVGWKSPAGVRKGSPSGGRRRGKGRSKGLARGCLRPPSARGRFFPSSGAAAAGSRLVRCHSPRFRRAWAARTVPGCRGRARRRGGTGRRSGRPGSGRTGSRTPGTSAQPSLHRATTSSWPFSSL